MTRGADTANPGWLRPPLVYLSAMVAGALVHLAWPVGLGLPLLFVPGALAISAALLLFFASRAEMDAAGTPLPGNEPTTAIVSRGPFRLSRNPVYLAFSLLHLGVALCAGSAWLLATLPVAVGLMAFVVIPREERYLEAKFGSAYVDYKKRVRRWL